MTDDNPFHLFNTKTMSGIHPGSRTAQANIIRWQSQSDGEIGLGWARILWPGEGGDAEVYLLKNGQGWADQPALRVPGESSGKPIGALMEALTASGRQPRVCGTCRWWQPLTKTANPEGVPLGLCSWADDGVNTVTGNCEQSALALECPHWQTGAQTPALLFAKPAAAEAPTPSAGWWAGLKKRLMGKSESNQPIPSLPVMTERSGVGAGTERCLACHGRIANLGALTLATESDDKRTVSVWRCRLCHTFYLNDWIDRWERLDSLETDESYYRLAPGEAFGLLTLFRETPGGEHPKERHSRGAQRLQIEAFLKDRLRLLHQIKQGR